MNRVLRLGARGLACLLPLVLLGCRGGSTHSTTLTPTHSVGPDAVQFDDEPGFEDPSMGDLEQIHRLTVRIKGSLAYDLELGEPDLMALRYYGLPCYPSVWGAGSGPLTDTGSQAVESDGTDDLGGPYSVTLVTPDSFEETVDWYGERLDGWAPSEGDAPRDLTRDGALRSDVEPERDQVIYTQMPQARRRVTITRILLVDLTLIAYEVLEDDGEEAAPRLVGEKARQKWEHIAVLTVALDQYARDTGSQADSVDQLTSASGAEGYAGPYLPSPIPLDPYTGEPYTIRGGQVVGPGDVVTYLE